MKPVPVIFLLLGIWLHSGCAHPPTQMALPNASGSDASEGRVWGVMVGVSAYQDSCIGSVPNARRDAWAVYDALIDPEGLAVPFDRLVLLVDEEATRAGIVSALRHVAAQARSADTVLVYFSGCGTLGEADDGSFTVPALAPHDLRAPGPGAPDLTTPLSLRTISALFEARGVRLMYLLDAAFANEAGECPLRPETLEPLSMERLTVRLEELIRAAPAGSGRAILVAGQGEWDLETPEELRARFSQRLLAALCSDTDGDGLITLAELQCLIAPVASLKLSEEHIPFVRSSVGDGVVLGRAPLPPEVRLTALVTTAEGKRPVALSIPPVTPTSVLPPDNLELLIETRSERPLHVAVLRFVRRGEGVWSERLLPDGENRLAPAARVSPSHPLRQVVPAGLEHDTDVVYLLVSSVWPLDLASLDGLEQHARASLAKGQPEKLAVAVDRALRPGLRSMGVALHFLYLKAGQAPAAPEDG